MKMKRATKTKSKDVPEGFVNKPIKMDIAQNKATAPVRKPAFKNASSAEAPLKDNGAKDEEPSSSRSHHSNLIETVDSDSDYDYEAYNPWKPTQCGPSCGHFLEPVHAHS